MGQSELVIVSNRGPLSFEHDEGGQLTTKRGAGGLVTSLGPAVSESGATWMSAAITDADREAAGRGLVEAEGFRVRSIVVEADEYRRFYDVIANSTLWYLHHDLWDLPRRPRVDRHWHEAWASYVTVNHAFAAAVADEVAPGGTVLVQDYHLSLLGAWLRKERPDVKSVHFHHTPFCHPAALRALPDAAALQLLEGLAGHTACGFHARRWADAFTDCAGAVLGTAPTTFVAPAATDPDDLMRVATSEKCAAELSELEELLSGRALLVRVDRIEPSKNIVRGFYAFDELLRSRPEWRERVVFAASLYPSREALADYLGYRQEIESVVAQLNERWATSTWTPVLLDTSDDFARSVAALRRYDVLLVNPIRDGLNLVAKEGPLVNERDGVLVLSREAGASDELGSAAIAINPFDIVATAAAIEAALTLDAATRADRAGRLQSIVRNRSPQDWLADQLAAASVRS